MKTYLAKMKTSNRAPARPPARHIFWSWCGGALAIGTAAAIAVGTGTPTLMAPFGATAVLAFGVPDSPLAQPRNIIGGHTIAALVGVMFLVAFGASWWSMGLSVATAIAMMQVFRAVHPPAGANPLVVMYAGVSWDFVFAPVFLGALLLAIVAVVFNNMVPERRYPLYWF